MLQPGSVLSGVFESRLGPVDVAGVLRVVDDARDEERARLQRLALAS